ncbi:MAG: leucine--tRNA ligase [Candidatus Woesearchaeota archaeon]
MASLKEIQDKWQKKWNEAKIFEANPDNSKDKFFVSFPYPYINGFSHIGHLYTMMRVEAFARYKRLKGHNVLFPQGWHITGSPIVNAAKRVKTREPKQMKIMNDMGISEQDIPKFEDSEHWVEFFAPEYHKDYKAMGLSIDWRRTFYTTSLNPYYDKFIRWQFRKLKEKGYVIKGKFPVVWDPVEKCAVGDHARVEGEGEVPQEFCLFRFKLDDGRYLVTATLRPDTLMGITNVYVNPDEEYVEIETKDETWIVGKPAVEKLKYQDFDVSEKETVKGIDLVGKKVTEAFSALEVPVLPATFLDSNYGTGVVHSVPSDSADDLIALRNIQDDDKLLEKYNLDKEEIKSIEPIAIFETPGLGKIPAKNFLDKYGVKSQNDRKKLDNIKKELYTLTFNKSTFNDKYKKGFSKDLSGMLVKDGQEIIKNDLLEKGMIYKFYELTGKVVSRTLTECVVKIVDDQWFMNYNDPEWKKLAHECLDQMELYPEKARAQFDYVIDWLHEWACTRKEGLGTRLPWDEKWIIESLSDSTIYMAYYTIAHMIESVDLEKIDDNFFDYIFLSQGTKPDIEGIDSMKENFEYFYPMDFRNSGKDLVQNHLTFFIFNHVAIFPKDKWPKGIGANGWVTVDGQKMSKSLGNMIPMRRMATDFTADASRMTILNGGEELDDPNWDTDFAKSIVGKLLNMLDFAKDNYGKHEREDWTQIDSWFESEINRIIKEATSAMEQTLFRTALQKIYFEMQSSLKYYLKRTNNDPHEWLINKFIEDQAVMLSPYTPHICEEIWEAIGKDGYISNAKWPLADESKINEELNIKEKLADRTISDIRTVQNLAKLDTLSKIRIFISEAWKYDLYEVLKTEFENNNRDFKSVIGKVMSDENLKKRSKDVTKMLPNLLNKGLPEYLSAEEEFNFLNEISDSIKSEFDCDVEIIKAQDSDENKSKQAMPGKPAILVE